MSDRERVSEAIDAALADQSDKSVETLIDELRSHGLEYGVAATVASRLAGGPQRALIGKCLIPHASNSVASVQPIFDPTEGGEAVMYWQCTEAEKHRTEDVATIRATP